MNSKISEIGKIAPKLSKNPLGIIALMLVLVDAIAGFVLGFGGANLDFAQKWILTVFIVIFPFCVLFVLLWLVVHHHMKLYAPGDFREDTSFLRTISPEEHRKRLIEKVHENERMLPTGKSILSGSSQDKSPSRDRFVEDMMLAEDLAIRDIEWDFRTSVRRHTSISGADAVTGAFHRGDELVFIEIEYRTQSQTHENNWLDRIASRFRHRSETIAEEIPKRPISCLFILVLEYGSQGLNEHAYEIIVQRLQGAPVPTSERVYNFQFLKIRFTIGGTPNNAIHSDG